MTYGAYYKAGSRVKFLDEFVLPHLIVEARRLEHGRYVYLVNNGLCKIGPVYHDFLESFESVARQNAA